MQEAAESKFAQAKKQDDPGMMSMYASDAEDMFRIAKIMQGGDHPAAYEKVCNMDTAARDEIPAKVYEFLEEEANA
jgi:hypothetical protein